MNAVDIEQAEQSQREPLTRREREVLELLAEGLTSPEVAERMTLAVNSVRWYMQQIYAKLGVNSKRQAIARATELGILQSAPAGRAANPESERALPGPFEAFPPLAARNLPHNLPPELTSFIGRELEIARLQERFANGAQRLITLTGAGGTGKTRLAIQVGRAVLNLFPDGVWLVELAPLNDPQLVVGTLAQCLGVHESPSTPYLEALANYLEKKRLLLILDNCEHLLQECARVADFLLRRCPKLALLATSREILNLAGEAAYRVPSLSLPDPAQHDPAELTRYEAVKLFIQRACQAVPDFRLNESNATAVATICRRLDGMPLAIELAAARTRMMTAQQIAARLDDVFRLLTGGSRNVLPRQQTLKAAIDWSYALLSPQERILLQRLSVFAGTWTLEAAEAVCAGEGIEAYEVLDLLGGLVDKSLVQVHQMASELEQCTGCYRMLETVRQYARDRLLESGSGEAVRDRHLSYYLKHSEQAGEEIIGPEQVAWVHRLESELENLRLALEWSLGISHGTESYASTAGRTEDGLRLATALLWFWHFRNRDGEGLQWLQNLMDRAGVSVTALAAAAERFRQATGTQDTTRLLVLIRAIGAAAYLAYQSQPAIERLLDESISLCRAMGEPASSELSWALIQKGICRRETDRGVLNREFKESLEISQRNGYHFYEGFALAEMGRSIFDLKTGAAQLSAALAIFESIGESDMTATERVFLAFWHYPTQDYDRCRMLLQQGLAFFRKLGNLFGWCRWAFWQYRLFPEPANAMQAEEALAYIQDHELDLFTVAHINLFAETEWTLGNFEQAEDLARLVLADIQSLPDAYVSTWSHLVLGRCALSRGDLGRAREHYLEMTAAWGDAEQDFGLLLPEGCLEGLAVLLAALGKMDPAATVFGAVDDLHQIFIQWPLQRAIKEHDAALSAAQQVLGEAAFAQAWEKGKAMTLKQAFEFGQNLLRI